MLLERATWLPFPCSSCEAWLKEREDWCNPKAYTEGAPEPETFKPAKGSGFDFPGGKVDTKKRWRRHPPCGKINNPFGSLWVWGGCLLLGFDCSTLWSRFHMLVYCFDSKCKRITQRDPERISNTSDFSQTLSKFADVSCGFRSDATKSRLPKLKGHLQIFAITTL